MTRIWHTNRFSKMNDEHPELDNLQAAYKNAVDTWIASIRREEELASAADHSVTEVDQWENAHFSEEGMRNAAKAAKKKYEDALRAKFFGF
jgi:lysophospholipase L1-like esterase